MILGLLGTESGFSGDGGNILELNRVVAVHLCDCI